MKFKYIYILFFVIAFFSCEKEEVVEFKKEPNKNPPLNNNKIVSEKLLGNSNSKSSVWQLEQIANNYYGLGKLNAADATYDVIVGDETSGESYFEYVLLKLSENGEIIDEKHPGFKIRYILPFIQANDNFQNGIIAVGLSGSPAKARLLIYDNQLTSNSIGFTNPEENTWFNSITFKEKVGDLYYFIAAGGKAINDIDYPYVCELSVHLVNKTVIVVNSIVLNNFPNSLIANIKQSNSKYFCSLTNYLNGDSHNITILCLSNIYQINWQTNLQYLSYVTRHSINSMVMYAENIYISSYAKDPDKGKTASGSLWDSGLVTCINENGTIVWQTKVAITDRDEELYGLKIFNNNIYALGIHSCYISKKKDVENWDEYWQYGNALICKLDLSGNIITNFSLGNENYENGCYDIANSNGNFYTVGWSNCIDEKNYSQGWFLKLSNL